MDGYIALMILSFFLLLVMGGFFIWGLKTRQFHDPEEPKYHILDHDKPGIQGDKKNG